MKTISRFIALKIVCGFLVFAFGEVTFAQDDLNSGLAAYYPYNGNANDESGNGNHGTVFGASLTTDRSGNADSAYSFDGVNDYIDIGKDASLKMTDGLSISAWINIATFSPIYQ